MTARYGDRSYWRDELVNALAHTDSRWSVEELLTTVSSCDAGLVNVAGWLSDEISMGRVRLATADDRAEQPARYTMVPGASASLRKAAKWSR